MQLAFLLPHLILSNGEDFDCKKYKLSQLLVFLLWRRVGMRHLSAYPELTLYCVVMRQHNYYTYILTNAAKKVLYTGVTNDLDRRLYEHYFGADKTNSFTGKYKCYYLVWYERYQYINDAIEREKEIKGWLRSRKNALIELDNPEWRFLNADIMDWPPVKE